MSMPPNGPYPPDPQYGPPYGPPPQFGGTPPGFQPPRRRRTGLIVGAIIAVVAVVAGIVAAVVLTRGDDDSSTAASTTTTAAQTSGREESPETSIGPTRLERTRTSSSRTTSRSSGQSTRSTASTSTGRTSTSRTGAPTADEAEIGQVTEIVVESTTADALSYYCSTFAPDPNGEEVIYELVAIDNVQVSGDTATADVTLDDQGDVFVATLGYVRESDGWKFCPS